MVAASRVALESPDYGPGMELPPLHRSSSDGTRTRESSLYERGALNQLGHRTSSTDET